MSDTNVSRITDKSELDPAQAAEATGGGCTGSEIAEITSSLVEAYDNLVDFASHVMGRVLGEP